jgi:hypothetical protein
MAKKTGFGAVLGCLFITLVFMVAATAVTYAQVMADDNLASNSSTNQSDPNYDPYAAQQEANGGMMTLAFYLLWAITLVMCGVTLIVALTML